MDHVTGEVRCLLKEVQDAQKQGRACWRRDVVFQAGDEVLLDTTFTPLPSCGLLSSCWQGPFKVIGPVAAPNTNKLKLPLTWQEHNEFNVDRLCCYVRAPDWMVADWLPSPSSEVSQVLQFLNSSSSPSCLVHWVGEDASRDLWEPVANLLHLEEVLHDFELATGTWIPLPDITTANPPAVSPPSPVQPSGVTIVAQAEAAPNVASLVGCSILYWFPDYWWQQGFMVTLSKWTPEFPHNMAYSRAKAAFEGTADILLDMSF